MRITDELISEIAAKACSESQNPISIFSASPWDCAKRAARIALERLSTSGELIPDDAFAAIEGESNQLRELCTKHRNEASELRSALDDLLSWFPDKPSDPEWRLKGGQQGADDAVAHARNLVNLTPDT